MIYISVSVFERNIYITFPDFIRFQVFDKNLHHESKDRFTSLRSSYSSWWKFSSYNLTVLEQKDYYFVELNSQIYKTCGKTEEIRTKFFLFCFTKMILATLQEKNLSSFSSVNYQHIILHFVVGFISFMSFVNCMTCNKKQLQNNRNQKKDSILSNLTIDPEYF